MPAVLLLLMIAGTACAQPIRLDIDPQYDYRPEGVHIVVKEVIEGGLADRLGIQENERIELFDGEPIQSVEQMQARLAAGPPLAIYVRDVQGKRRVRYIQANQPPVGGGNAGAGLGGGGAKAAVFHRLTNEFLGTSRALDASPEGNLSMAGSGDWPTQQWQLTPAGGGRYRLKTANLGPGWSLTAVPGSDYPKMRPTNNNSSRQLWRIEKGREGYYQIVHDYQQDEWALDVESNGANSPMLALRGDNGGQMWKLKRLDADDDAAIEPPVAEQPLPDLTPRLISRKEVANPPLKAVNVELENSHDEDLQVVVRDLRDNSTAELEIAAGTSRTVELDRDAGGTILERWEIPLRSGEFVLEQRAIPVPPQPIYRISVFERFVQSVAIDATKKGKQTIEDISYSSKSVGVFAIPPGAGLKGGRIDVYAAARRQGNPGGVDQLELGNRREAEGANEDPIKKILRAHQKASQ
jgi:hypothetical protein